MGSSGCASRSHAGIVLGGTFIAPRFQILDLGTQGTLFWARIHGIL